MVDCLPSRCKAPSSNFSTAKKNLIRRGVVAKSVILATWEVKIESIMIQDQLEQKVDETTLGAVVWTCHSTTWSRPAQAKITITERAGGMAQVVEYPLSKHQALSSTPKTTKINK
jgi:hypothetical protein